MRILDMILWNIGLVRRSEYEELAYALKLLADKEMNSVYNPTDQDDEEGHDLFV